MKRPIYPRRCDLISAWVEHFRAERDSAQYNETFWAYTMFNEIVTDFPDEAFSVILEILALDSEMWAFPGLAAGPLEDLLVRHGERMIGKVEAEAQRNPAFRRLLGGVWPNAISDDAWARVSAIWDRRGWDGNPEQPRL